MKPILLISDPSYDASLAVAAAHSLGLRFRHVRFWEQVSHLTVTDAGGCQLAFDGVESENFSAICVSTYPDFAIHNSYSEEFRNFLRSEWISALNTYIYLRKRPLLNAELLGETCNFHFSSKFLLPLLHNCGWEIGAGAAGVLESFYLLLIDWRFFQSTSRSSGSVDIAPDLLDRTHDAMRLKSLDFLILRAVRVSDGSLHIVGAHISPPSDLPKFLWEVIWNELSIF